MKTARPRSLVKAAILRAARSTGLFQYAARASRGRLRILCYHGFSDGDESAFRPKLFMRSATFRHRMKWLTDHGFSVLTLSEALEALRRGRLPERPVVITIDDGWTGAHRHAWPILSQHGFPATLYVTSYYVLKQSPVFGVALEYIFWKTDRRRLALDGLGIRGMASAVVSLESASDRERVVNEIVRQGESDWSETRRAEVARQLADRLGLDYHRMCAARRFSLMSSDEIVEAARGGLDIQLHTHRHRFPLETTSALRELSDNRRALEPLVGRPLTHFCYPSGQWSEDHWQPLLAAGIESAVTCDPGLNDSTTPPLGLRRFLDGETVSQLEFEAELWGLSAFLRNARSLVLGRAR